MILKKYLREDNTSKNSGLLSHKVILGVDGTEGPTCWEVSFRVVPLDFSMRITKGKYQW